MASLGAEKTQAWRPVAAAAAFLVLSCSEGPLRNPDTVPIPYDTGVEGLPETAPAPEIRAKDGDTVRLEMEYVAKWIAGRKVRMLAYNRSIPGPTIRVAQNSRITLLLVNKTDLPTSLHSHGLRLEPKDDGVIGPLQPPIEGGRTYAYNLYFPDPGAYWYHPHAREDYQMELGLYGNYLVEPEIPDYWPPANREITLMLDDILLSGNVVQPFHKNQVDFAMMGRFGNHFLVNGDTACVIPVKRNETVRFYVTNASGSRTYNLRLSPHDDFNILGGDNGAYEYPQTAEMELIAPSERLIFNLYFPDSALTDTVVLMHWPMGRDTLLKAVPLAKFAYTEELATPDHGGLVADTRNPYVAASIDPFRAAFDRPVPDEELLLTGWMDMSGMNVATHDSDGVSRLGIEWYDHMGAMNRLSTKKNMFWFLRDVKTGKVNHEIDWKFQRGSQVLIRIRNDSAATSPVPNRMMHPMPHPIHFHGNRFLVLRENGVPNRDLLVWKDTHLIGMGFTVDLLLDASNPGPWMFHCHIPEHLQTDMMGHYGVLDTVVRKKPLDWSLSLRFADAAYDSLRQEALLVTEAQGQITGRVHGYDPAVLAPVIHFASGEDPAPVKADVALAADGSFSFAADSWLGATRAILPAKAAVRIRDTAYRAVPDTVRLGVDRRRRLDWTLDLDLDDAGSFAGLDRDTAAQGRVDGMISGRIAGYDSALYRDSVYIQLGQYPDMNNQFPVGKDGSFSFDAIELLYYLDGNIDLRFLPRPRDTRADRAAPEAITVFLNRTLDGLSIRR